MSLLKVLLSFDLLQQATDVALDTMERNRHSVSGSVLPGW